MRCMERNKQPFWYSNYGGIAPIRNEDGYLTGEQDVIRLPPVRAMGNISPSRGEAVSRAFGDELDYDRVIALDNPDFPVDEQTVIWIGITPELDGEGNLARDEDGNILTPWNYEVRSVAPSLNSVNIAVRKVNVR